MTHLSSPLARFLRVRLSRVPEGGWTQKEFATAQGIAMMRDMVTIHRLEVGKGIKRLSASLDRLMRRQVEDIVLRVESHMKAPRTVDIDLPLGSLEEASIWEDAMRRVMGDYDDAIQISVRNVAQSVADGTFDKTSIVLGYTPRQEAKVEVQRRVSKLASQVTRVQETTRARLRASLERGIEDGLTTREMVQKIRREIPEIARSRVPTIARTEMGRAADEGRKLSVRESGVVTHVSVVGCEAIEPGIPTFRGVPTCNISFVPVENMDELEFHPNHQGTIIPSRFVDDEGDAPGVSGPEEPEDDEFGALLPRDELSEFSEFPTREGIDKDYGTLKDRFDRSGVSFASGTDGQPGSVPPNLTPDEVKEHIRKFRWVRDVKKFHEDSGGYLPDTFMKNFFGDHAGWGELHVTRQFDSWNFAANAQGVTAGRTINFANKSVSHDLFEVDTTGTGLGKKLIRQHLKMYRETGIETINVHANIDVGGYAWARFGFIPYENNLEFIKGQVASRAGKILGGHTDELLRYSGGDLSVLTKLQNEDWDGAETIGDIAALTTKGSDGVKLGKKLLLNTDWSGSIDLTDETRLKVLETYVGAR